jgi:hypothetical protein
MLDIGFINNDPILDIGFIKKHIISTEQMKDDEAPNLKQKPQSRGTK